MTNYIHDNIALINYIVGGFLNPAAYAIAISIFYVFIFELERIRLLMSNDYS